MDLELDLTVDEIAGIFTMKGWQLADTEGYYPLPEEIGANIENLVWLMKDQPDTSYANLGRITVTRDDEFPGSVEIHLNIGYAMPSLGDDADSPEGGAYLV